MCRTSAAVRFLLSVSTVRYTSTPPRSLVGEVLVRLGVTAGAGALLDGAVDVVVGMLASLA
jgi:hypothetical protein